MNNVSDWEIKPNGGNVAAINRRTGEVFAGTFAAFNVKAASAHADSVSRNVTKADVNQIMSSDSSSAVVYTITQDIAEQFDGVIAYQAGTGAVSFAAGPGVTIRKTPPTPTQYAFTGLLCVAKNEWAYVNS